jgi:hypothetical protein
MLFGSFKLIVFHPIFTFKTTKMKVSKLIKALFIVMCMTSTLPAFSTPVTPFVETPTTPANTDARISYLLDRLQEIKEMAKQNLSRSEKRELKKEVKAIRKELKEVKNGIYLSFGAIIIIILLLILLL